MSASGLKARAQPLQSMTGFASAEGEAGGTAFRWELRSVNGKGLDAKLRLPPGCEGIEPALRRSLAPLGRGTVQASLKIAKDEEAKELVLDEEALAAAVHLIRRVRTVAECDLPRPEAILAMRGVLAPPPAEDLYTEDLLRELKAGFERGVAMLLASRTEEGGRIAVLLRGRLDEMSAIVADLRAATRETRHELAEKLRSQIEEIAPDLVSDDRIAQEVVMLAIKADVTEELDRLDLHLAAFAEQLEGGGPAGRRLEFLTQELMREASTLTVKLHRADLKQRGLDLKELTDSLREQVLNLA